MGCCIDFICSWSTEIVIVFASLAAAVYLFFRSKFSYFKKRGIPFIEPSIPFGSFKDAMLVRKNMIEVINRLYKESDGLPYVGFYNVTAPVMMFRDPELIQNILIKDFSSFVDRGVTANIKANPLDQNLVSMRGSEWRALRNKLSPVFTSGKLKAMYPLIDKCALELQKNASSQKGDIDLKDWLGRYTTDVVVNTAFGVESDAITNPNSQFYIVSQKIFQISAFRIIARMVLLLTKKLGSVKTFSQEVEDFFMNLVKNTMAQREKNNIKRNDFIQCLMELKSKGQVDCDPKELELEGEIDSTSSTHEAKLEITDFLLGAQSFVFFLGGFDPTSNCLAFTSYFLSKNQSKQEKARDEVMRMVTLHDGLTYEALKDMKYLEACINESLRMLPPGAIVIREATKDYVLKDGVKIEKGTMIFLPTWAIHMDPQHWVDPDTYLPERFMEPDWRPAPGTYFPFGDGPRVCIGERYARVTVKLALARLLQTHRLVASPKNQEPLRVGLSATQFKMEGGLWVRLAPL